MAKKLENKQIQGIQKLLTLLEPNSLTRKEFTANFSKILKFLTALKEKNRVEFENFKKVVSDSSNKLKGDNTTSISELKQEFAKLINKALKDQEDGMNFIRDKVRRIKNGLPGEKGMDADEEKIIKAIMTQIKLPEQKEMILDTPEQIADKLETLKGDEKLEIKAIENLEDRLKELENRPLGGGSGGVSKLALDAHFIDDGTPSGTVDGANKAFVLANTPNPPASVKVFADGQRLNLTEDYTFSARTITFVDAPLTDTIIKVDYKI